MANRFSTHATLTQPSGSASRPSCGLGSFVLRTTNLRRSTQPYTCHVTPSSSCRPLAAYISRFTFQHQNMLITHGCYNVHFCRPFPRLCSQGAPINVLAGPPASEPSVTQMVAPTGTPLSSPVVRPLLTEAGIDASKLSGHSFHRGVASSAAQVGFTEYEIQQLGRWRSDAHKLCIDTSRPRLLNH